MEERPMHEEAMDQSFSMRRLSKYCLSTGTFHTEPYTVPYFQLCIMLGPFRQKRLALPGECPPTPLHCFRTHLFTQNPQGKDSHPIFGI